MVQRTTDDISFPVPTVCLPSPQDSLTPILRAGAQRMLAQAIEAEVAEYIERHAEDRDSAGRRQVVRNGYKDEREIQTGIGPISVRQPRVNDKRLDENGRRRQFTSAILPPYLRRTRSIEELIPWLYLKGISTGDFSDAPAALLGTDAPGLSASTVVRLAVLADVCGQRRDGSAMSQSGVAATAVSIGGHRSPKGWPAS